MTFSIVFQSTSTPQNQKHNETYQPLAVEGNHNYAILLQNTDYVEHGHHVDSMSNSTSTAAETFKPVPILDCLCFRCLVIVTLGDVVLQRKVPLTFLRHWCCFSHRQSVPWNWGRDTDTLVLHALDLKSNHGLKSCPGSTEVAVGLLQRSINSLKIPSPQLWADNSSLASCSNCTDPMVDIRWQIVERLQEVRNNPRWPVEHLVGTWASTCRAAVKVTYCSLSLDAPPLMKIDLDYFGESVQRIIEDLLLFNLGSIQLNCLASHFISSRVSASVLTLSKFLTWTVCSGYRKRRVASSWPPRHDKDKSKHKLVHKSLHTTHLLPLSLAAALRACLPFERPIQYKIVTSI